MLRWMRKLKKRKRKTKMLLRSPVKRRATDNENNIYELTVIADDGELRASVTFTITVEDSPDIPAKGSRSFTINENTVNTVVEKRKTTPTLTPSTLKDC